MTSIEQIKKILIQKKPYLKETGIKEIGIFGSYLRGDQNDKSDLDILIDLTRPSKLDLLDLISLENDLSDELGLPIDLVLKSSLKPSIGKVILSEVEYI